MLSLFSSVQTYKGTLSSCLNVSCFALNDKTRLSHHRELAGGRWMHKPTSSICERKKTIILTKQASLVSKHRTQSTMDLLNVAYMQFPKRTHVFKLKTDTLETILPRSLVLFQAEPVATLKKSPVFSLSTSANCFTRCRELQLASGCRTARDATTQL